MHWRPCDLVDRLATDPRTGLVFVDEFGHRRDYTFAEIAAHSARYAAVLRAFGLHENERVYVRLSATGKCIFTLLALQRIGAHAVLEESAAAGASTIIANRKHRSEIDALRQRFAPDTHYVIIGEEQEGWARLDTLARIASPMEPEPMELDEAALEKARAQASEKLAAAPSDVIWCTLHIEEPDWFEQAIVEPWLSGCTAVAHGGGFDARERLDLVRELEVTILLQRADEYHAELAVPDLKRFKMPRLRRCVVLDEGCDELLQSQWLERFGVPLTPAAAAASPRP